MVKNYPFFFSKKCVVFPDVFVFVQGIARKLINAALQEAAKKREMRYSDLKKIEAGVRRHFHDDISVIVLFLDYSLISRGYIHGPSLSVIAGGGVFANGGT